MENASLKELLIEELKDLHDAEKQITKALPKMVKQANSPELKGAFEKHLQMTETQIERLSQAFELLGEKVGSKPCKAMKGLLAEGEDLMEEHKPSALLDAALVGAAQRVEHYEIAAYGTLCAYADALHHSELSSVLRQTLDEEKQTDELLSSIGIKINEEVAAQATENGSGHSSKVSKGTGRSSERS